MDSYYYLLEDLHTVTGLLHKNGQLAEAYSYGAYGDVEMFSYHPHDLDRDGGVVDNDDRLMSLLAMHAGPADDPLFDVDFDGDSEIYDYGLVFQSYAAQAPSAVPLRTSGIGNPYFFTGRNRHFLDDLTTAGANDNKQLQYNRARHYDPKHGRWLQRDPAEYVDGMNLYEYVRSMPTVRVDTNGLWSIGRFGNWTASATSQEGDTLATLGTATGLDPNQWKSWLKSTFPDIYSVRRGGKAIRVSHYQLHPYDVFCPNQRVQVPNTIFAHWGGFDGGLGKRWVNWGAEIETLKRRGFAVDERTELSGSEFDNVLSQRQGRRELHGIYVWGHGSPDEYQTKFSSPDGFDCHTAYSSWGLGYRMGFGYIGACDSVYARPRFSANAVFWGYEGTLNPVIPPWHWGFTGPRIAELLPPGAQGTRWP